ncbi:MAG: TldD/PmbA family protein [Elusimicrobia bacterium]|nr:TldD/PmbA family protein [Elusimicrobiota bacterium]
MKEHQKICGKIFSSAGRRPVEALISSAEFSLTRFADNVISQNVSKISTDVSIRILEGRRMAKVSTNQTDAAGLKRTVEKALWMLKFQKEDRHLLGLPKPLPVPPAGEKLYFENTAGFSPEDRAKKINETVKKTKGAGQTAYGTLDNGWSRTTVANSAGVFASHLETSATFSLTTRRGDGFGWAEELQNDVGKIDFEGVAAAAVEKAGKAVRPREIKPGKYTVILEPAAVAEMLMFMNIYGFGGRFYLEGQSFMSGKMGQKVLNEKITIEDDSLAGPCAGMPFDFEGMPRKKVVLVADGIARGVVHDRKTGLKMKTPSTGHSLPQPNTYGPIPVNVVFKKGNTEFKRMLENTREGILVTQFHYVNILKPVTLEMTGMTRNGTYFIHNGEIAYPVKNLRFTESIVGAFNRVEEAGDRLCISPSWFGKMAVPALKIQDFNFSSATQF